MPVALSKNYSAHFFLAQRGSGYQGFSHLAVLIAEGLVGLGWTITSNVVSWQEGPQTSYLFPGGSGDNVQTSALIIFEEDFFKSQSHPHLPPECLRAQGAMIYLDGSDLTVETRIAYSPALRRLDLVLRTHSAAIFAYPSHFRPLPFGISNRIARACEADSMTKVDLAMWNFRHVHHPHSTRIWAERAIKHVVSSNIPLTTRVNSNTDKDTEYGQFMRAQTDGRHFTSYYQEMKQALVCACFGGWFLAPARQKEAGRFCMWCRGILKRLPVATHAIAQWDSWRLWEAFAAGTAVLHFNFEQCGFLLGGPPPEAMKHYIPVSLSHPAESLTPILEDRELLLRIGQAGRKWALEHYTSKSIANRMLIALGIGSNVTNPLKKD